MPNLFESLQGRDLGHLKIIASLWGLELNAPDARIGLLRLCPLMLDASLLKKIISEFPIEARKALIELHKNEGRLPWAFFTRQFGTMREYGAGKRDRERPFINQPSTTEYLWYRGLIARGFFDQPGGLEEFAYIPDDILALLPFYGDEGTITFGRPASPSERVLPLLATDKILDRACILLAALRMGFTEPEINRLWEGDPEPHILMALLRTAGLLGENNIPLVEPVREFLESNRAEALALLVRAWQNSVEFNELSMLPGIALEGEWRNDALKTRRAVINFLPKPSEGIASKTGERAEPYWSLSSLVSAVRQYEPDFERPAGDYQSWYIRDLKTGEFLKGFESWDLVDGALIKFIITGPMHWLGILDLASPGEGLPPSAFRYTPWAYKLLRGESPSGFPLEEEQIIPRSDAQIWVPRLAPRSVRYQIARFSTWQGEKQEGFNYLITPHSLEMAKKAGLRVGQLINLLRRYAESVPPALIRALLRWEEHGTEIHFKKVMVLRLNNSEILQKLRNSRAARFLGDLLGPTSVIIKPNGWVKVQAVLAEMGYLSEIEVEEGDEKSPE